MPLPQTNQRDLNARQETRYNPFDSIARSNIKEKYRGEASTVYAVKDGDGIKIAYVAGNPTTRDQKENDYKNIEKKAEEILAIYENIDMEGLRDLDKDLKREHRKSGLSKGLSGLNISSLDKLILDEEK